MLTKFKKGDRCRIVKSAFGEKLPEGFEVENERVIGVEEGLGMYWVNFTSRSKGKEWTRHQSCFSGRELRPAGRKAK